MVEAVGNCPPGAAEYVRAVGSLMASTVGVTGD